MTQQTRVYRFGPFHLDAGTLELHRDHVPIELEPLPARLLVRLFADRVRNDALAVDVVREVRR